MTITITESFPPSNGQSVLGTSLDVNTFTAFANVGVSVALPAAGTYLLNYSSLWDINVGGASPYAWIIEQLYDTTNSAAIANSQASSTFTNQVSVEVGGTMSKSVIITTTGAVTINLQAKVGAGTYSASTLLVNGNGGTVLNFVRIA